jgi:hypothetical protein
MTSTVNIDLKTLTAAQRRDLFNHLSAEFNRATSSKSLPMDIEYYTIISELIASKGAYAPPMSVFVKNFGVKTFSDRVSVMDAVITRGVGRLIRKGPRTVLNKTCLECLVEYLDMLGVPATMTTMLNHASSLEVAIERCYPGYIDARLIDRIIGLSV